MKRYFTTCYMRVALVALLLLVAVAAQALMMDYYSLIPAKGYVCTQVEQKPILSVSPTFKSYSAAIGSTQSSDFTLANSGNRPLTGLAFSNFSTPTVFAVYSTTCGTSLAAGAQCTATVQYTGTSGTVADRLCVGTNEVPDLCVNVSGVGE